MGKRGPKAKAVEEAAFVQAVAACKSIACVLRAVGLIPAGANYQRVKWVVRSLGLDTSHWTGQGHRKGSSVPVVPARPLAQVLAKGVQVGCTHKLRKRLIREGVFTAHCSSCGNVSWMGLPIPLELDHVDGDRDNNELANLRLLCPNCHAQTPTYRAKNVGRWRKM